jgi:hypothetical protein
MYANSKFTKPLNLFASETGSINEIHTGLFVSV